MTYYHISLVQTEDPDKHIPIVLSFVPRPRDFIRTSHLDGRRGYEVIAVYAHEPEEHDQQGLIEVHVRAVAIPDVFTQPES